METLVYPQKPKTHEFVMDVPYANQLDNSPNKGQGHGSRHCNATSAAMLAKYLKPDLWQEYKHFPNGFLDVLQPFGDTTDHNAITRALRSIGIESYFSYTASLRDVQTSLYNGIPCLIGVKYKVGGHVKLVIGRGNGFFVSHDPYGSRRGTSDDWIAIGGTSGKNDRLSASWMRACFVDQGESSGWARFVTSEYLSSDRLPTGL
jgi:hypothetical protein